MSNNENSVATSQNLSKTQKVQMNCYENGQGSPLSQKKPQPADIAVEASLAAWKPKEHIGATQIKVDPRPSLLMHAPRSRIQNLSPF